jgi:hypothetical protein
MEAYWETMALCWCENPKSCRIHSFVHDEGWQCQCRILLCELGQGHAHFSLSTFVFGSTAINTSGRAKIRRTLRETQCWTTVMIERGSLSPLNKLESTIPSHNMTLLHRAPFDAMDWSRSSSTTFPNRRGACDQPRRIEHLSRIAASYLDQNVPAIRAFRYKQQ